MNYRMDVKGKVAIVTGGLSGIGLGISKALTECLAEVVIFDIKEAGPLRSEFKEVSDRIIFHQVDVTQEASVEKAVKAVGRKFGKIDILINNAGIANVDPIGQINLDTWKTLIEINLNGAVLCANSVVPWMRQAKWGRIVNIASVAGMVGFQTYSAYGASKAGIRQLTKIWASELSSYRITVNSICPGWVKTPLLPRFIDRMASLHHLSVEGTLERVLSHVPQRRFLEVKEIAFSVLFLCSDLAQGITGTEIVIDAGMTCSQFTDGLLMKEEREVLDYGKIKEEVYASLNE